MSNILKAKVLSPKDATEAKIETKEGTMTVFKFIGTKNNIENAKALMDYLVNSHNELDLLMVRHADPLSKAIDPNSKHPGTIKFCIIFHFRVRKFN